MFYGRINTMNASIEDIKVGVHKMHFYGMHGCGPNALVGVCPKLKHEDVTYAFKHSSRLWPYGGVSNREFNIALRVLKIRDSFRYKEEKRAMIKDFIARNNETFILLLDNHFTIVKKGVIEDTCNMQKERRVYHSWKFIEKTPSNRITSSLCDKVLIFSFYGRSFIRAIKLKMMKH